MAYVALQPATSRKARENAKRTLEKPIKLDYLRKFLAEADFRRLEVIYPDRRVFVWGVKVERYSQWEKIISDATLVLFRRGTRVVLGAVAKHKLWSEELAGHLWGEDEDGEIWSLIYFLTDPKPLDVSVNEVSRIAGLDPSWNWQGFIVISPPEADAVIHFAADHVK